MVTLATKYRPKTWDDVIEQENTKRILFQQIKSNEIRNAYLFCGSAGTGKTTCARIFANEINHGVGNPIEMDAASQNGVNDVRNIIQQARTQSIDSEYKVFIIDECHAFSNNAWQAMLKIIEEPPAKCVFIFCTTDPQKIPATIISRVQRYQFTRISQKGIVKRLWWILDTEGYNDMDKVVDIEPLEYIAKIADGGMRDAITMMEKCLAYSSDLTLENVVKTLGTVDYDVMFKLVSAIVNEDKNTVIRIIEEIHDSGKDLKQFIKQLTQFILDINKYVIGCDWKYMQIPKLEMYQKQLDNFDKECDESFWKQVLEIFIELNTSIKYSSTVKYDIEAVMMTI